MTVYVFPGQGSQRRGMGKGVFEKFPELVTQAQECLGYSVAELCLHDPDRVLDQTRYTQPALYVVSALEYLDRVTTTGELPSAVAGHSLGSTARSSRPGPSTSSPASNWCAPAVN